MPAAMVRGATSGLAMRAMMSGYDGKGHACRNCDAEAIYTTAMWDE
ncbi:MAG: hypothetical protein U9N07_05530 [Euryarchaeota archaeon]|nr:hypothetical protein [Euryarchaeota archaeon]